LDAPRIPTELRHKITTFLTALLVAFGRCAFGTEDAMPVKSRLSVLEAVPRLGELQVDGKKLGEKSEVTGLISGAHSI
jgi:hypothetical protein